MEIGALPARRDDARGRRRQVVEKMAMLTLATDDLGDVFRAGHGDAFGHVLTLFGQEAHLVDVVQRRHVIHRVVLAVGRRRRRAAVAMMVAETEQR